MIWIENERLRCGIAEPKELLNQYRFDRTGYVFDVILDGEYTFCASEPHTLREPSSGGRGLCSEIGRDFSGEVSDGEYYPKLGVGLIRKCGQEPYVFYKKQKDVIPFETDAEWGKDYAVLTTEPMECLGYSVRTVRTYRLRENVLTEVLHMENCGRSFDAEEYCHNFVSIDGMALGPDYRLDLPNVKGIRQGILRDLQGEDSNYFGIPDAEGSNVDDCRKIGVSEYRKSPCLVRFDGDMMERNAGMSWKMTYLQTGVNLSESDSFVPSRVQLWSCDHMLSPEIFAGIHLKEGESAEFSRVWKFEH